MSKKLYFWTPNCISMLVLPPGVVRYRIKVRIGCIPLIYLKFDDGRFEERIMVERDDGIYPDLLRNSNHTGVFNNETNNWAVRKAKRITIDSLIDTPPMDIPHNPGRWLKPN